MRFITFLSSYSLIEALDSIHFAIKSSLRLFGSDHEPDDDPFLTLSIKTALTGMPILEQSIVWFDCKLEGHLSPDADCRLYLGRVVAAHICDSKRIASSANDTVKPPTTQRRKAPRSQSAAVTQQYKQ